MEKRDPAVSPIAKLSDTRRLEMLETASASSTYAVLSKPLSSGGVPILRYVRSLNKAPRRLKEV